MTTTAIGGFQPIALCALALGLLTGCGRAQTAAARALVLGQSLATEVDQFVAADRVSPPALCQVLFVGSSSIVRWKESLAADMAPMPVINRGFGGSHIEYVNRWFDKIVAPYRPRAIVFYAGDNDIDAGKSVDRVVEDFDTFMALKSHSLGATPVYFISIKPSTARLAELSRQREVNEAIRTRAGKRSDLIYLDVASPMLAGGKPKDIFVSDGLHMNRQGYAIWTQVVRPALLANTDAEERSCGAANYSGAAT
jgi:GDSL-like Lipase/Acylhydrolase family